MILQKRTHKVFVYMFDEKDLEQFKKKGTSADKVKAQLELIQKGFPFLELEAAASVGNGIMAVDDSECDKYIKTWDAYCTGSKHIITKFEPLCKRNLYAHIYFFCTWNNPCRNNNGNL